ncbi:MAG: hypothetical protein ACQESE_03790 [Nanobdellota archaeon]
MVNQNSRPMGFKAAHQEKTQVQHDHKDLEKLGDEFQKEIHFFNTHMNALRKELKEFSHMKNNLDTLTNEFKRLKKLVEKKDVLLKEVTINAQKSSSKIDVDKEIKKLQHISHYENQIVNMSRNLEGELQKLIINETHELYASDQKLQQHLKQISEQAENMLGEARLISTHTHNNTSVVQQLSGHFHKLKQELS